jgi:hypothetical protein
MAVTPYTPDPTEAIWRRFLGVYLDLPPSAEIFVGRSTPAVWTIDVPDSLACEPGPGESPGWPSGLQSFETWEPDYWCTLTLGDDVGEGPCWILTPIPLTGYCLRFLAILFPAKIGWLLHIGRPAEDRAWLWGSTSDRRGWPRPGPLPAMVPLGYWEPMNARSPLTAPSAIATPAVPSRRIGPEIPDNMAGFSPTSFLDLIVGSP